MITDIHHLQDSLRKDGYVPVPLGSFGFTLTNSTPSHTFTAVVVLLPVLSRISVLASRDFFDERLAIEIAEWLLSQQDRISLSVDVQLLNSFTCNGYGYSGILALGPQCHHWFVGRSSDLHSQTIEVFPIYKGELSGDESPEEIDTLRHEVICTVDWRRQPSPQARVIVSNESTGVSTRQYGFVILPMRRLLHELGALKADTDSVTVRNVYAQECVFFRRGQDFVVTALNVNTEIQVSRDRIESWVRDFLQDGL
jgi:hypothetical protein